VKREIGGGQWREMYPLDESLELQRERQKRRNLST